MSVVDEVKETIRDMDALRTNYKQVFLNEKVLLDLQRFCYAHRETYGKDSDYLNGRRSVWLRIQQMLELTPVQLSALYSGGRIKLLTPKDDDDA